MSQFLDLGMTDRPTGTVVVPAYNEAHHITESLQRISAVLVTTAADHAWEILVIDDGSTDGTSDAARAADLQLRASGVQLRVLRHITNLGLGSALQTGFAASTGDVVIVVDSDLSYDPEHIPRMVEALETSRAQVAVASPYMAGGNTVSVPKHLERRSRVANWFLSAMSQMRISTYTGMVRAYDGEFIRGLSLKGTDDTVNVETLYKTRVLRGRAVEVPATLNWSGLADRAGRTGIRKRKTRVKAYLTLLNGLLFRPHLIFMWIGFALMALGAILGVVSFLPVTPLSLTVWAAASLATGVIVFMTALISIQVKRYFEELFVLGSRELYGISRLEPSVVQQPSHAVDPVSAPTRRAAAELRSSEPA